MKEVPTAHSSWATAHWGALVIVIVVFMLLMLIGGFQKQGRIGGLINGLDNRWSTSKISIVLWTFALLWAFIALLIRYRGTAVFSNVPASYLALLGIPAGAALGAKAITSSQEGPGAAKTYLHKPTMNPITGIGQVFSSDGGTVDLLDSQYFLFNLVLLAYFIAGFLHLKVTSTTPSLPILPGSLLALSGVSAASYLGKKALPGGPTLASTVTGGSSLQVSADSDVSFPGGGTVALASPGEITICPGITYSVKGAASVEIATGGSLTCNESCHLKVGKGAIVTALPGERILFVGLETTALISNGAHAVDAEDADVGDAGPGLGKRFQRGSAVTFANAGKLILTGDTAELELPAGAAVSYVGAGTVTVPAGPQVHGTLSTGLTVGQTEIGDIEFPQGAIYVDAIKPGPAQTVGAGGSVSLSPAVAGNPALSITLVQAAEALLEEGTEVSFPGAPASLGSGVKTTAASVSRVELPSGGEVEIDPAPGVAVHVPNGSIVSVPDGRAAASVAGAVT